MNRHLCVLLFVVCFSVEMQAQSVKSFSTSAILEPYRLEVGYNKTTHLVFPLSIISIDRGSASILAQKATGVENILKVKADQKAFEETSLNVITSDGKLYSFLVCYNGNPGYVSVSFDSASANLLNGKSDQKATVRLNEALLAHYAKLSLDAKRNIRRLKDKSSKVSIAMEGIYVKEGTMFLRFQLRNGSNINYDVEQLRIFQRDKVQSKRTASQETEILPLRSDGETASVKANSQQDIILAIPKITVPNGKYLAIEMTEAGGGRNLKLNVKAKHILKAMPLD
jgi:conjugative transposon TraN protein